MPPPNMLLLAGLAAIVAYLGYPILFPSKPKGRSAPAMAGRSPGRFDDVAEMLEARYLLRQREEVFGVDRRLEALKTELAAGAIGHAPPPAPAPAKPAEAPRPN